MHRLVFTLILTGWFGQNLLAAEPAAKTREFVAILQSDAPLFDKARACQQLGEIGTSDAVTVLAKLIDDPKLSAFARSGLEGIPGFQAADALREAAHRVTGPLLAGVVNSLGVVRHPEAVPLLSRLASDQKAGVSKEALLALGNIGNQEAIRFLLDELANRSGSARDEVAAACLLAAERQRGNPEQALSLYELVRGAGFGMHIRVGATRGAILARTTDQVPFLLDQLKASERPIRNAAFLAIREISDSTLPGALNAEVKRASGELQELLLLALADRHNAGSIEVVAALADSSEAPIRKTALTVLGRMGPSAAPALLNALQKERASNERALILAGLKALPGAEVDSQLVPSLTSAKTAASRIDLIQLIESRFVTGAAPDLVKQARAGEKAVSLAALSALRLVGSSGQTSDLIEFGRSARDEEVRDAAEAALVGICGRSSDVACGPVLEELKRATTVADRNSWIRVLARAGCMNALPVIEHAARDNDPGVAETALIELGRWPTPAPIPSLLRVVEAEKNASLRARAFGAIMDLTATAIDDAQMPVVTMVGWLKGASIAAQSTAEKVRLLGLLGRLPSAESYHVLVPFMGDEAVRNEAGSALLQIAPALGRSVDNASVRAALEKVSETNPELRERARQTLKNLPKLAEATVLFDGQSLAGWEGNTNVWRVQDGVIVGGSMTGNPRNEFLASERVYTNFVLRLEYKLVGSEGFVNSGVQFQSERITNPPNEMRGYQADIGAGFSGVLYDESRRNTILARASEDLIKRIERAGDWNQYEIQCDGRHIQLRLNGEKTVDYTELDVSTPLSGRLGLQIHGGNKAEVSFRHITIQEF